jgi:hypothetical protein
VYFAAGWRTRNGASRFADIDLTVAVPRSEEAGGRRRRCRALRRGAAGAYVALPVADPRGVPARSRRHGAGRRSRRDRCPLLHPDGKPFIPLEFADAAYRYGHSQIRQLYQLQPDGPLHPVFPDLIGFCPVGDHHIDWSLLFDVPGRPRAQRAKPIEGQLPRSLIQLPEAISGAVDDDAYRSLATRDVVRGEGTGLPSGEAVARLITAVVLTRTSSASGVTAGPARRRFGCTSCVSRSSVTTVTVSARSADASSPRFCTESSPRSRVVPRPRVRLVTDAARPRRDLSAHGSPPSLNGDGPIRLRDYLSLLLRATSCGGSRGSGRAR